MRPSWVRDTRVTRFFALSSLPALFFFLAPSHGQNANSILELLQERRHNLYEQIAPGVVSVELVHHSVPARLINDIQRKAYLCKTIALRNCSVQEEDVNEWITWCNSFVSHVENSFSDKKASDDLDEAQDWASTLRESIHDWKARYANLPEDQAKSFSQMYDPLQKIVEDLIAKYALQGPSQSQPLAHKQYTGFLVENGVIVTALDVARYNGPFDTIRVSSSQSVSPCTGELLGRDPETNIAVIRLANPHGDMKPTLSLDSEVEPRVGDYAFACWHAFGQPLSMRSGEITGVLRKVPFFHCATFLETSFPTSPGTLGSPVVNLRGDLIGVNNVFLAQGTMTEVTHALPVQQLKFVVDQIITNGSVQRGRLGVSVKDEPAGGEVRVIVKKVYPNTPAATVGILPGDILWALDGQRIVCKIHLVSRLSSYKANDPVELTVDRDSQRMLLSLALQPIPDPVSDIPSP